MRPPVTRPVLLILGSTLAASTLYLLALLFGYVFGIGHVRRHHVETASYVFVIAAALTAFSQTAPRRVQPSGTVRPRAAALLAGLVAASCVLYGNTLRLGLFSDDFVLAERALHGRWLSHGQFVRPLPSVLWGAILSATRNPAALHLLSIVLHGANAALVSILASRIGLSRAAAVAAGLLFLAFPSNVEAVVWPAALPDLLVATCALAFLHLARGRISRERALAALAVLVCGLLCKESAIAIPLVAIVFWVVLPEGRRTAGWPVLASAIVICIAYAIVRITVVHLPESYAQVPSRYLLKELIARPFGTLVLPWTTVVLDRWPLFGYLPAFAVVAVGATYAGRPGKAVSPSLVAGYLLAALVAVLPVYSMLFISADLENARYLYLSTAFWATAVCGMASRPDDKARIGSARTVIFVGTHRQRRSRRAVASRRVAGGGRPQGTSAGGSRRRYGHRAVFDCLTGSGARFRARRVRVQERARRGSGGTRGFALGCCASRRCTRRLPVRLGWHPVPRHLERPCRGSGDLRTAGGAAQGAELNHRSLELMLRSGWRRTVRGGVAAGKAVRRQDPRPPSTQASCGFQGAANDRGKYARMDA